MKNDTILILYGTNTMKENGQHQEKGRSVLFAHTKMGFPMKKIYPEAS